MSCKSKPLETQGSVFLEGVLHVIVATEKKPGCTKESPKLVSALYAPEARKSSHVTLGYSR